VVRRFHRSSAEVGAPVIVNPAERIGEPGTLFDVVRICGADQ
jgi:hypothetical protein